jgi:O-methyltransferase involved in polyketide biosynthesis
MEYPDHNFHPEGFDPSRPSYVPIPPPIDLYAAALEPQSEPPPQPTYDILLPGDERGITPIEASSNPKSGKDGPAETPDEPAPSGPIEVREPPALPEVERLNDATPTPYDDMIPTALLTSAWRAHTGLHLAPEVDEAARAAWEASGRQSPAPFEVTDHAAAFEMRHRVTDQLIEESGHGQILDIGAGLTPRGLIMAENPNTTYVELDLPIITELKNIVAAKLAEDGVIDPAARERLHQIAGDGLDLSSIREALHHFDPDKPITVLTEGVMHYLYRPERAALAESVGTVLSHAPGSEWITDMPTWEGITNRDTTMAKVTSQMTGRDVPTLRFETHREAREFFAERGLAVAGLRSFLSVIDDLRAIPTLGLNRADVVNMNRPWSMWRFKLRE